MNRDELIQRKEEVRAEISRLQRQLAGRSGARSEELDRQMQALMAEERRLRMEIDRSR